MKVCLFLALSLARPLLAEDPRVTALIQRGDEADARHDSRVALLAFEQAAAIEPENFGALLRISKQYTDLMGQSNNGSDARALGERALDYGRRAVALDEKNAKAHLNLAVCYGKLTEFASNKAKVEYAKVIRDEALRSIELDSSDDYAWHVLGRWHAEVANLNGVLKTLANLIYGGLPPASNDDAVRCLKKAAELAPQRITHHAELARVYRTIAKNDSAAQEWQNVVGLRAEGLQDEQYQLEAKGALEYFRLQKARATRGVVRR